MKNKISVYELLGLIKDGKVPKMIKYNNRTYEFKEIEEGTGYVYESGKVKIWLSNEIEFDISRCLNEKVEILEEDRPIIEKIHLENMHDKESLRFSDYELQDKLNEVIDYINRREDK